MGITLNFLFSDGMVLQREKEIRVWGEASPQEHINVCLCNATEIRWEGNTEADGQGAWAMKLPPQPVGRELTLEVSGEQDTVTVCDVAVGEVWIAAGQSNMEFAMRYDADFAREQVSLGDTGNGDIRFFDVPRVCYEGQLSDFDYREYGRWKPCDRAHLEYFSAVGYYFARELASELQVPVGIVGCNRGGSIAAAWMDEESLKEHGGAWLRDYAVYTPRMYQEAEEAFRRLPMANTAEPFADPGSDRLMYGMDREEQRKLMEQMPAPQGELLPQFNNRPECLYHHMLRRIIPYTARGIIWYQGESDCIHPQGYGDLFLDLVRLWRKEWEDSLPFLTVQLAPFGQWLFCEGTSFPVIRREQLLAAERGADIYVVSSSDVGMEYDIHPKKKAPIGQRLALCAAAEIYGRPVEWRAPLGREAGYRDGILRIGFSDGEGLHIRGDGLSAFVLKGQNGMVIGTDAGRWPQGVRFACEGDSLFIYGLELAHGSYEIAFAESGFYQVNLYNRAGIPAMPFTLPVQV